MTTYLESAKELFAVLLAWAVVFTVGAILSILLGITGVWDWGTSLYL